MSNQTKPQHPIIMHNRRVVKKKWNNNNNNNLNQRRNNNHHRPGHVHECTKNNNNNGDNAPGRSGWTNSNGGRPDHRRTNGQRTVNNYDDFEEHHYTPKGIRNLPRLSHNDPTKQTIFNVTDHQNQACWA